MYVGTSPVHQMITKVAAFITLAIVLSGSFTLSTQSLEAKTSRSSSHKVKNYFVPPPPPYAPSILPLELSTTNAPVVKADADLAVKPVIVKVVQPNSSVTYDPVAETKAQKRIDYFDSKISSIEKEIGDLLKL